MNTAIKPLWNPWGSTKQMSAINIWYGTFQWSLIFIRCFEKSLLFLGSSVVTWDWTWRYGYYNCNLKTKNLCSPVQHRLNHIQLQHKMSITEDWRLQKCHWNLQIKRMADWDQQQRHNIPLGEQTERAFWDQQQLNKNLQEKEMAMTGRAVWKS